MSSTEPPRTNPARPSSFWLWTGLAMLGLLGVGAMVGMLWLVGGYSPSSATKVQQPPAAPARQPARRPAYSQRLTQERIDALIHFMQTRSDCLTCHRPEMALIGPAFQDVGTKYLYATNAIDKIRRVIRLGSEGQWGRIPMAPHPEVDDEQAREIALWILSLGESKSDHDTNARVVTRQER